MEKLFDAVLKGGTVSGVYFSNSISELKKKIDSYGANVIYVFDENTRNLLDVNPDKAVVLKSGEEEKNYKSIDIILKKAIELSLARDSIFIAIGGGVVCDMTAFAASVYMRGARTVLVPTTLLSMVDASVGGKTGIDYSGYKNIVGTFFPAEEILISLETLQSLNDKEYLCGLGEVVKHAFLSPDGSLFDFLKNNHTKVLSRDLDTLSKMVELSLLVKKHYIELDPEEKKGIRSSLNLGHTFAHALESVTEYSVSHGEAVAWGVDKALRIGDELNITRHEYAMASLDELRLFPFRLDYKISQEQLPLYLKAIRNDKKKSDGSVKFILLKDQGEPVRYVLDEKEVESVVL